MVGILVSFWDGLFSGAMLVLGSVISSKLSVREGTLLWSVAGIILDALEPEHQPNKVISKGGNPPDLAEILHRF